MEKCRHYALYEDPTWEQLRCIDCNAQVEGEED